MKILYAGDSEMGGSANYLLGALRKMKAHYVHVPPSKILARSFFKSRYDAIILSDFSRSHVPGASEGAIIEQVEKGTGLLMIGGWGSFSGPFGGWHGSLIEKILPVSCQRHDDRLNFPGGALIHLRKKHRMFGSMSFKNPPVICGLNRVRPRKNSQLILGARRIVDGKEFPLLVIDSHPHKRIAALTTDLAPHWCGGLVDWGRKRVRIKMTKKISIEVGDLYVRFVSNLLKWLAGTN